MPDTTKSLERYNDPTAWDHIDRDVPIFTEHELWEVPHPWKAGDKVHLAVLPGDEKPKTGSMLYSIGEKELLATAQNINRAFTTTGNTVGVHIGHRNQNRPEQEQPKLVGEGVKATYGTFGPQKVKAVLLDKICYFKEQRHFDKLQGKEVVIPGTYQEAKTYPHRSPEFKPLTGQLTGLALLRNDPKLPLGMMTYKDEDRVCYGAGALPETSSKGDAKGGDDIPAVMKPKGTDQDPTQKPTASEPDAVEHEKWVKHMDAYKRRDPMMLQMCKNYETECAAAIAPEEDADAMPGEKPGGKPGKEESGDKKPFDKKKPKEGETQNMADEDITIQYKALTERLDTMDKANKDLAAKMDTLASTNQNLTTKYAQSEAARIESRLSSLKVIKDRKKLRDKLAATDDAGRKAIFDDVIENYADLAEVERDPSKAPEIEVYSDPVEGGAPDPVIDEMDMSAAVRYAEENKLDFAKDYVKICAAMKARV